MFRLLLASMLLLYCQTAQAITVRITTPPDGGSYTAPATLTVSSRANVFEDSERVTSHKIYRGSTLIASESEETLSTTVSNLPAGNYTFYSQATNNLGQTVTSTPHDVTVVVPGGFPPTVSMGTPTGAPFIAPATVGLSATAADSDGTITKVQFFANNSLIGTDTAAPYQISWTNAAAGTHSIVAKATDNNNITTTSSPVSVTVAASVAKGVIDGVYSDGAGGFVVTGWACSTGRDESIRVHGYAGGPAGTGVGFANVLADQPSEAAVAAACYAQGTNYRFRIPLTDGIRQQHSNKAIYLHGIGEVAPHPLLQRSGVFTIPAPLSLTRTYTYDAHQRLCKSVEPETGATLYGYDDAGNLAWSAAGLSAPTACDAEGDTPTIEERIVLRDYDARNRLKELSFPDGRGDQTWEYTPDGLPDRIETINVVGATNPLNLYAYNARRLLEAETQELPNWYANDLDYGYDRNGHLKTLQYPSGQTVDFAPNALGQATKAGAYASSVTYHANGSIAGFTYGNGIAYSMTPNDRQLPARTTHGVGVLDFGYAYDPNGNVGSITDYVNGRQNRTMGYDGLDRLETVTSAPMYGSTGATYGYDGLDNLTRVKIGGAAVRDHFYCYDTSYRLTNVKTGSCSGTTVTGLGYDLQGNLSNKNGQTFDFDYGNRLREVMGVERYRYDAFGRRILAMNFGSGTLFSQYGQSGQLLYQENTRTGQMKEIDHIYLAGSLVAQREVSLETGAVGVRYLHTDALGSPVVATNSGGTVTERMEYEPYGDQLVTTASIGQDRPGYTGHVRDAATDLSYMQQRYYDPGIGRFLSVDPVSADPNTGALFNRYMYANNNPYKFTDPDGRQGEFFALRAVLATAGADAVTPDPSDVAAPGKAAVYTAAIVGTAIGGTIVWAVNKAQEANSGNSDGAKTSDRPAGPDGKSGSTGGPGEGKRFGQESPATKADKEGAPCRYCGQPTTNTPGQPNSRERDHIDPKSRGGNNSSENEGDSCRSCNREKGARNPDEWKKK